MHKIHASSHKNLACQNCYWLRLTNGIPFPYLLLKQNMIDMMNLCTTNLNGSLNGFLLPIKATYIYFNARSHNYITYPSTNSCHIMCLYVVSFILFGTCYKFFLSNLGMTSRAHAFCCIATTPVFTHVTISKLVVVFDRQPLR